MSNIIDSIQLSGVTYDIGGSGGGNPTVELTQAQYDELVASGTVQSNTYYIITDASAGDLTQYWTSAQTNSAITAAVSGKQDTLVSGTNIKTINNESILGSGNIDIQGGGGGKAIAAGTNISVTTGETADTVNCTLPLTADTNSITFGKKNIRFGNNNITTSNLNRAQYVFGDNSSASGIYSFAFGVSSEASAYATTSMGYGTKSNNNYQTSFGRYPLSSVGSSTFGDSGNTLFCVGNALADNDNARHNAFEIRQNGDIYLTLDGQDVKLQDQLGGGGSITVDQTIISGSTNAVAGGAVYDKIDEVEQVTAAALNNINDRLSEDEEVTAAALNNLNDGVTTISGQVSANTSNISTVSAATASNTTALGGLSLVKLTQAQYDALSPNYDSNTLYVIT